MDEVENYYSQPMIHWAICKYVYERTLDFIIPRKIDPNGIAFRYRRAVSPKAISLFFDKFNIMRKPFNIYASNAKINPQGFPIIDMRPEIAKKQVAEVTANYSKYLKAYDLRFDLDHEDIMVAHAEAIKVKDLLDEYHVPYWVMFSGNKGFNFCIDSEKIPQEYQLLDLPEMNLKIAENISRKLKLKTLDLSVYTLERVFKVPYSVARERNLVALPLTDDQLENFSLESYDPKTVLRTVLLKNRGLLEREGTTKDVFRLYRDFSKTSFLQKITGGLIQ